MRHLTLLTAAALLFTAAPVVLATTSAPAMAKKGDDSPGIPLEVQVVDKESGEPIKTAKVRNPQEKEPHPVNADNGIWKGDVLYLPDGQEIFFEKGMQLTFEVSAPSYQTAKVDYIMRKRKNRILVELDKMKLDLEDIEEDDPVIQFGRDKPIGGREID